MSFLTSFLVSIICCGFIIIWQNLFFCTIIVACKIINWCLLLWFLWWAVFGTCTWHHHFCVSSVIFSLRLYDLCQIPQNLIPNLFSPGFFLLSLFTYFLLYSFNRVIIRIALVFEAWYICNGILFPQIRCFLALVIPPFITLFEKLYATFEVLVGFCMAVVLRDQVHAHHCWQNLIQSWNGELVL